MKWDPARQQLCPAFRQDPQDCRSACFSAAVWSLAALCSLSGCILFKPFGEICKRPFFFWTHRLAASARALTLASACIFRSSQMMAGLLQLLVATVALSPVIAQMQATLTYNSSFVPWEVMGPVRHYRCVHSPVQFPGKAAALLAPLKLELQVVTGGSGYTVMTINGSTLNYEFHLANVQALKSIELHIGQPGTHGDVAAVFYAAAFANLSSTSNGLVAKGTLADTDLLGPLLLPLGDHLSVTLLQEQ